MPKTVRFVAVECHAESGRERGAELRQVGVPLVGVIWPNGVGGARVVRLELICEEDLEDFLRNLRLTSQRGQIPRTVVLWRCHIGGLSDSLRVGLSEECRR